MTRKVRVRLVIAGTATYRRVRPDRGWGGPYGQDRRPARWACIDCGRIVDGTDDRPMPHRTTWWDGQGQWDDPCARNGHAPCWACGKPLPRLNDGCPREHVWTRCPAKTEADAVRAQHAHAEHQPRRLPQQAKENR